MRRDRARRGGWLGALCLVGWPAAAAAVAPNITSVPDLETGLNEPYRYDADGRADADGDAIIEWSLVVAPTDMAIDNLNGLIYWLPTAPGAHDVELAASNGDGEARQPFVVEVLPAQAPVVTGPVSAQLVRALAVNFQYEATGATPMVWTMIDPVPPGAALSAASGRLLFIPINVGAQTVHVRAINGEGAGDHQWTVDVVDLQLPSPTAALSVAPASGDAPLRVVFDASASVSGLPETGMRFDWDFGDGQALLRQTVPTAVHEYLLPSSYLVRLLVTNLAFQGDSIEQVIEVRAGGGAPPRARIIAGPEAGPAPLQVAFTCECEAGDSPLVELEWSYGDGEGSRLDSPEHIYAAPGGFVARVTVVDERGLSATDAVSIEVRDGDRRPPFVRAHGTPPSGDAPLTVAFLSEFGDHDGLVVSRQWVLPDGSFVRNEDPLRTFQSLGVQHATLEVKDDHGLRATDSVDIIVTRNGAYPPTIRSSASSDAVVGQSWSYDEDGRATAAGTPPLRWELGKIVGGERVNVPEGMTVDEDTGRLAWTPTESQVGEVLVSLQVSNAAGSDVEDFAVTVVSSADEGGIPAGGCGCQGSGPGLLAAIALVVAWPRRRNRMAREPEA